MKHARVPRARLEAPRVTIPLTVVTVGHSRVKSVKSPGMGILETAFAFGASLCRHVSRVSAVTGVKRVGSRSSELSSPLESRCIVACQNCQQSQSGSILVSVVAFGTSLRCHVSRPNSHREACQGRSPGNCRRFRSLVASSCVQYFSNHGDGACLGCDPGNSCCF